MTSVKIICIAFILFIVTSACVEIIIPKNDIHCYSDSNFTIYHGPFYGAVLVEHGYTVFRKSKDEESTKIDPKDTCVIYDKH